MNSPRVAILLCLGFLVTGCPARSIFPLFTDKDVSFNPLLVGTWTHADGGTLTFAKSGVAGYHVTLQEKDETSTYTAQIGKLGNAWFIESSAENADNEYHLLTASVVHRMWLERDSLTISALRNDWLKGMIDDGKLTIPHVLRDGEIILTASTEELQKFVTLYADSAFTDRDTFYRKN